MVRKPVIKVILFILIAKLFFLLLLSSPVIAQNPDKKARLSCPEKWWAITHVFSARKTYRLTKQSLIVTDSILHSETLDGNISGGQVDAFKHAYWMATITQEIGPGKARSLGKAHEKGNYRSYKKGIRKGYADTHDKASTDMDLWNNQAGIEIALAFPEASKQELTQFVIDAIRAGKMKIILRNNAGQFLDANGKVIPEDVLVGTWENGKVLVSSGYQ